MTGEVPCDRRYVGRAAMLGRGRLDDGLLGRGDLVLPGLLDRLAICLGQRTGGQFAQPRRQRIVDAAHFHGVAGVAPPVGGALPASTAPPPALLRPLAEYERAAGGGWS